jgi:Putative beta-barrel porin 2
VEFRQSDNGGQNQLSPIFQIGVVYQPFDGTEININASRRTLNSATLTGQDFTSTQFVFTARQRLLQRLFLSLTAGYQNQTYFSTIGGLGSEREDNYYFIAPGFDVKITNFLFTGVYYFHRENNSSFNNFSFDDNQFGVHISLTF